MKKNYICPVVEVNAFDFEDVVMTSGVTVYDMSKEKMMTTDALSKLKTAAGTTVVVEW